MFRALLRRSVLAIVAAAGLGGNEAAAQSFDANIVSRVESFIPTSPETVLPTKTKKVPVKRKEQYSVTVDEKKELSMAEREAKAKEMGVVVPLGLRSTTARKAYLNLRNVPTYRVIKVRKQKTRVITEIVEKKVPRKTVVRGIASTGYTYATNANQADVDIIPDSIGSQNGNLLILVPAGREEDTVSFLLGPSAVRYATLDSSSFDALNASVTYTRLLGRRQTAGLSTGGTARTDLLTIGLDGVSTSRALAQTRSSSPRRRSAGRARISALATGYAATRAARPIAITPISRFRCPRTSPTSRARSAATLSSRRRSAGGRRSRTCRCRRPAACKGSISPTIQAAARISSLSAAATSAGILRRM